MLTNRRRLAIRALILTVVLTFLVTPVAVTANTACVPEADFRASPLAVLERGVGLGDGLTCLVYGRKRIFTPRGARWVKRIVGEFEHDGGTIRFETLRGARTPRSLREGDPDAPRYEMDVRFVDGNGHALLVQTGGCQPVDSSWDADEPDGPPQPGGDAAEEGDGQQQADFARVQAAIGALASRAFRKRLAPEYRALLDQVGAAQEAMTPNLTMLAPNVLIENDDGPPEQAGTPRTPTGIYRHVIGIYEDRVGRILPAATHGATRLIRQHPNGSVELIRDLCNHGRCPAQMGFPAKCAFLSAFNRQKHVHVQTCRTWYDPRSVQGTHNCNDDTYTEYRTVRFNAHEDGVSGTCSDPYGRFSTPSCF
jgi:hypothetical protein